VSTHLPEYTVTYPSKPRSW